MSTTRSLIDEVLTRVDIVDVIGRYVPLKRMGGNFGACCPFHGEKTPSFMVSQTKQIFKCFGCGIGGNVFSFIQEIEKIDFWDAVRLLAEQERIDISQYQTGTSSGSYQRFQDEKEKLKRMHKLAQAFFVEHLQNSPEAMNYLTEKRKLTDQLISDFGIGFAPDKHYELLQYLRSQGFTDEDLLVGSLAKKSANSPEVFAFFRNRITFPIYDLMKNVVGFTARVLNPEDQPKYLNSSEHKAFIKSKILYGLSFAKPHLAQFQKLIVVEGQMDVVALARLGFPIGVATSGTALTADHITLLKRHTNQLYFLFDNDNAGQQATLRALKLCYQQDVFPKVISLPHEIAGTPIKDVDDLANYTLRADGENMSHSTAPNATFQQVLDEAQDGFLVIFERLRAASDMNSPIDKQKLINTLFELILSVQNLTIQEHYKMLLAEKLGFAFEILDAQFKRFKVGEGKFLMRQMERDQSLEAQQVKSYQPNREALLSALFLVVDGQRFLYHALGDTSEFVHALENLVELLKKALPDSLLTKTLLQTLSDEEKEELATMQLWREKEFGDATDQETKTLIIKKALLPVNPGQPSPLTEYLKQAQKSSLLSSEDTITLHRLRIEVGKR